MSKIRTYALAVVAVSLVSSGSYAGFMAGSYLTTQNMQRAALANACGILDPKTLVFSWQAPMGIRLLADSLPDISDVKQKTRGSK